MFRGHGTGKSLPLQRVMRDRSVMALLLGSTLLLISYFCLNACHNLEVDGQYGRSCVAGFWFGLVFISAAIPLSVLGLTQMPYSVSLAQYHYEIETFYSGRNTGYSAAGGVQSLLLRGSGKDRSSHGLGRERRGICARCCEGDTQYSWVDLFLFTHGIYYAGMMISCVLHLKIYVYFLINAHSQRHVSPVRTVTGVMYFAVLIWLMIHCLATIRMIRVRTANYRNEREKEKKNLRKRMNTRDLALDYHISDSANQEIPSQSRTAEMEEESLLIKSGSSPPASRSAKASLAGASAAAAHGTEEKSEMLETMVDEDDAAEDISGGVGGNDGAAAVGGARRKSGHLSPMNVEYVPSAYREDFACTRVDKLFALYLGVILPFLFVLCSLLPPSWKYMNIDRIRNWTSRSNFHETYGEKVNRDTGHLWRWSVSKDKAINFIPDVTLYYVYLICCFLASYLSRKSIWFRIEMRKSRILPFGMGIISHGEWVCFCVFSLVFTVWCIYWFSVIDTPFGKNDSGDDENDNWDDTANKLQRLSRGFARMSSALLALSLFPISRYSIWTHTFGVTFESALKIHKIFSHGFIFALLLHILFWILFLIKVNKFWGHYWFSTHNPYHLDSLDFTLPMIWWICFLFVFPIFGGLHTLFGLLTGSEKELSLMKLECCSFSMYDFRRLYFGYFSVIHTYGSILTVLATAWHGTYFWYYLLPPLSLIAMDHLTRLISSYESVTVKSMVVSHTISTPRHSGESNSYLKKDDQSELTSNASTDGVSKPKMIYAGHEMRFRNNTSARMQIVQLTLSMDSVFSPINTTEDNPSKLASAALGNRNRGLSNASSGSNGALAMKNLAMGGASDRIEYGLYFRMNIPALSLTEWHPFYVHSIDRENRTFTVLVECPHPSPIVNGPSALRNLSHVSGNDPSGFGHQSLPLELGSVCREFCCAGLTINDSRRRDMVTKCWTTRLLEEKMRLSGFGSVGQSTIVSGTSVSGVESSHHHSMLNPSHHLGYGLQSSGGDRTSIYGSTASGSLSARSIAAERRAAKEKLTNEYNNSNADGRRTLSSRYDADGIEHDELIDGIHSGLHDASNHHGFGGGSGRGNNRAERKVDDADYGNDDNDDDDQHQQLQTEEYDPNDITEVPSMISGIRLDGPFGVPIIHDAYRKIVLIVDGAGYAPVMGYFEYMLDMAIRGETQISVDLVWIAYDPHIFIPFHECLAKYSKHYGNDPDRLFDVRLFYYRKTSRSEVKKIGEKCSLSIERGFNRHGLNKINLADELDYLHKLGSFTILIAFGSDHLLRQCKQIAFRFGAHYRCDPLTY